VSSKSEELAAFLERCQKDGTIPSSTVIHQCTARDFDFDSARSRIEDLRLECDNDNGGSSGGGSGGGSVADNVTEMDVGTAAFLRVGSMVDFENKLTVSALGALIKYIRERRVGVELDDSVMCHQFYIPNLHLLLRSPAWETSGQVFDMVAVCI
jgi:hypothetical protein